MQYVSLYELHSLGGQFYQLGAALIARCTCGRRFGVGRLWHATWRQRFETQKDSKPQTADQAEQLGFFDIRSDD